MKKFNSPGSKTYSIPLKNPERVMGGEEAGGTEGQPGARDGGEGAEEEDIKWADGGKEVWRRGWGKSVALAEGARLYSGGIHVRGVRTGSHSVTTWVGRAAARVRAAKSSEFGEGKL